MFDIRKSRYFQGLPEILKESIMQCGVAFKSDEELEQYVAMQNL